jgi:5,10-methylenetetrahydromethanopterin reductase
MDISVCVARGADGWQVAVRAEQLGFRTAWFEDSQMVAADPIAMMAVAATRTSKIKLATGVLIPSNRIAPQTANSLATLNSLAPGRIIMGIGTGFSGRRAMGHGPVRVDDIRPYIETVNGLLRGETVAWEFENKRRKIAFLHPDDGVINLRDPVPTYVAAQGPRMRRLTADLGAGWINIHSTLDAARADMADMASIWRAAGHDSSSLQATLLSSGCPLRDGETAASPMALRQGGPLAAVFFHNQMEAGQYGSLMGAGSEVDEALAEYRRLYESYQPEDARYLSLHRGHALFVRDDEARFITPELITRASMTAPIAALRERIRELDRIGYDELAVITCPGDDDILERWADVMAGV